MGQWADLGWIEATTSRLVVLPAVFGFLLLVFYAYFQWLRQAARAWSGRLARRRWGGRAVLPLALTAGLPLALLLPPCLVGVLLFVLVGDIAVSEGAGLAAVLPFLVIGTIGGALLHPLAPLAFLIVCVLPLGAAVLRPGGR